MNRNPENYILLYGNLHGGDDPGGGGAARPPGDGEGDRGGGAGRRDGADPHPQRAVAGVRGASGGDLRRVGADADDPPRFNEPGVVHAGGAAGRAARAGDQRARGGAGAISRYRMKESPRIQSKIFLTFFVKLDSIMLNDR